MLTGVYSALKKDGTKYFRASFTYQTKHISLGSYATESDAHQAYLLAQKILFGDQYSLDNYSDHYILPFSYYVMLINLRDNKLYIKTPIYLKNKVFHYYFSPDDYYIFDADDLFFYSTHTISRRGGHLFVADYGMQVNILSRYGIKNHAVIGRDYEFLNNNPHDFRYENIRIINRFQGVNQKSYKGKVVYEATIHVNGNYLIGRYEDEITAAIAYNVAATQLIKKGILKEFPVNYIESIDSQTYKHIFQTVHISDKIRNFPPHTAQHN